jgi:hypothetical protein
MAHFVNFLLFLSWYTPELPSTDRSFILFATSDLVTSANCDALSGTDLHSAFCTLPKACFGIDGVAWYFRQTAELIVGLCCSLEWVLAGGLQSTLLRVVMPDCRCILAT